ncbi:hypothetical protein EKK58_02975 [Candidatus Dependentiae bacterium]|nr:MAG: hypothetical protein EKK58_02975 [Candidatus Dependentiae bacterium]
MINSLVTLAKKAGIKKIKIDFQKNNIALCWVPYFEEFGSLFTPHLSLEDGITSQYAIEE